MFMKTLSIAGLLSFGLLSAPVSAAPGNLKGADVEAGTTAAEQVHRRCWRHRGHWHCRIVAAIVPIGRMAITPGTMAIDLASACTSADIAIGTGAIVTVTGKRHGFSDLKRPTGRFLYAT